jgi:hypothetical protein
LSPPAIILWDVENANVPATISGIFLARQLQSVFGRSLSIKSILAFGNSKVVPERMLEELAYGGIKWVDVKRTSKGRKDVADKMILTEMFLFAMDNPPPSTIILISGDIDFANALSSLKFRGYRIILVPPHTPSRLLLQIPDEVVPWRSIVQPLGPTGEIKLQTLRASAELAACSISAPMSPGPVPQRVVNSLDANVEDAIIVEEIDEVTVEDFLDLCLDFTERGVDKILGSQVGPAMRKKYPHKSYPVLKTLVAQGSRAGWLTTEGSTGSYTLVFDATAMNAAWEQLLDRDTLLYGPVEPIPASSAPAQDDSDNLIVQSPP